MAVAKLYVFARTGASSQGIQGEAGGPRTKNKPVSRLILNLAPADKQKNQQKHKS